MVQPATCPVFRRAADDSDLVANAFKSCEILNALNGTEDEAVWEEGSGADKADDKLENEFDTDSEQED